MSKELFDALEALEQTRGISKEYMLEKIEAAILSAYKKEHNNQTNIRIDINPVKNTIKVFCQRDVVEVVTEPEREISLEDAKALSRRNKLGGICETEVKTKNFGRISAQAAKQVIIQGIREAERNNAIKEYESKKEEIVSAVVTKMGLEGNVFVNTGTSEELLLKNDQIPGEELVVGQHIKVFVTEVNTEARGPVVSLTRTNYNFIKRLFELEIPEIKDGTVVIRSISREPGSRTKIAVESRDENVDPIGACIGPHGQRIDDIAAELYTEKIDIIKYSDVPEEYIKAALSPAKVVSVNMVPNEKACVVYVPEEQLSLAIGKEGQNARLAAKLTGYKIDIKTESNYRG